MIELRQLCGALGAEMLGVDLGAPLDDATRSAVRAAFLEHVVLLFRGQRVCPAAQIAFTEIFGPAEPHPLRTRRTVEGFPQVLVLENRPGKPGARNDYWHSDISHAQCPPSASVLHALEVPPGRGDTMFCNMYAAYEGLSTGMRDALDGLKALHSAAATLRRNNLENNDGLQIDDMPAPSSHPVCRIHPDTKRKALYVNPHFTTHIEDMTPQECEPLLGYLYGVATRPENVYRHAWSVGDVLIWDNRCAMHYAILDYDESMPRLMHRTTAGGDRPS